MLIIGLTGGIGSGKSIVARVFKSLNVPIYDSDYEAKQLYHQDEELKTEIKSLFGEDIYTSDGLLNREKLSKIVFSDTEKLQKLNSIVHPAVSKHFKKWVESNQKSKLLIKEAAILIESNAYKSCDKIILVKASEETRIQRVMARDKSSREEVLSRMSKQMSEKEKEAFADYFIENDNQKMILPQIYSIYSELIQL